MNRWTALFAAMVVMTIGSCPSFGQGHAVAEGGGISAKEPWCERLFKMLVARGAREGEPTRVVILGAVALDEPDDRERVFKEAGAAEVRSLIVTAANADAAEIEAQLLAARVIFIRGGDQSRYVNWWRGTKTESAIRDVFRRGGVIAGTSAGCAILGEVTYDSNNGSLSPQEALSGGCHRELTLTLGFLGLVPGVIFDTHFTERARLGRLPDMLCVAGDLADGRDPCGLFPPESSNAQHGHWPRELLGIGVDPRTAVWIDPTGEAEVVGEGTATLLRRLDRPIAAARPGSMMIQGEFEYTRLIEGYRFDAHSGMVVRRPAGMRASEENFGWESAIRAVDVSEVPTTAAAYKASTGADAQPWITVADISPRRSNDNVPAGKPDPALRTQRKMELLANAIELGAAGAVVHASPCAIEFRADPPGPYVAPRENASVLLILADEIEWVGGVDRPDGTRVSGWEGALLRVVTRKPAADDQPPVDKPEGPAHGK